MIDDVMQPVPPSTSMPMLGAVVSAPPVDEGFFSDDSLFTVSTTGKIFLAAVAASLLGKISNVRVRGTQEQIDALKDALMASREFQDELERPSATVQDIMNKLHLKGISAAEFERRFGVPFPI